MLKILALTLILLSVAVYADDDTADDQDKQLVSTKDYWTYLPNQLWHQLGTYDFANSSLKVKAGWFNTSAVTAGLMRQYAYYGWQRDWYTMKCNTYKETNGDESYEVVIDSMGLPDANEWFLVNTNGKILCSKTTFDKMRDDLQQMYLNMAKCWANYKRFEIPHYIVVNSRRNRVYLKTVIRLCKEGWNEWLEWSIKDYTCVDVSVVGKYPDMIKHGDRDSDKTSP